MLIDLRRNTARRYAAPPAFGGQLRDSLFQASLRPSCARMRSEQAQAGETHSHSAALEHVAQQLGFRDWNACVATLAQSEARSYETGDHVSGHYLSQPFTARILRATPAEGRPGWVQVELELDHPVDVVTSGGFKPAPPDQGRCGTKG